MPGRIIQGMKQAGTRNPVFLLDEVDKLGTSYQGDPSSALLEVLDPAQNDTFTDHYLGIPFDLSEVLFIATANFVQNIPGPLLDRMEVVDFAGYTEREKSEIAKKYLIPRQLEESGLGDKGIHFTDDAVMSVVSNYTRESGVRQLERQLGAVARKVARKIAMGVTGEIVDQEITDTEVRELLGRPKVHPERAQESNEVGIATGMYYTPMGGDIMFVEASIRRYYGNRAADSESSGPGGAVSLILTGQLGDVMKESARAAFTYATNNAAALGIPKDRLGAIEAHIHVPAGAIPKDGPSAGLAIATALVSEMSDRAVRRDVAMTGEITLRGRALPIGGLKEKVLGAHRAGIKHVIAKHWDEIDCEFALAEGGGGLIKDGRPHLVRLATTEKVGRGVKLVARGTSGHGSIPRPDNAVVRLAAAVAKLGAWSAPMGLNDTTATYFQRLAEVSPSDEAARYRDLFELDRRAEVERYVGALEQFVRDVLSRELLDIVPD